MSPQLHQSSQNVHTGYPDLSMGVTITTFTRSYNPSCYNSIVHHSLHCKAGKLTTGKIMTIMQFARLLNSL